MVPRPRIILEKVPNTLEDMGLNNNTNTTTPKKELLYENYYYDVTKWVKTHPGGRVIEYYTQNDEDATIAIQQFHQRSTKKVMAVMNSLSKRPASKNEIEGISPEHKALTDDFVKLYKELEDEGMFDPSIPHVTYRILELAALAIFGLYFMHSTNPILWILSVFSLVMFFGRSGWVQHEGGHNSLSGNPKIDRIIQIITLGIGNGMSGNWWISQHNKHHAMPQRLHHDVDLKTLPLIAFNTKIVKDPKSAKNIFIQYQAFLFLAIDTLLVAILWKYYLHPRHVLRKRLYMEMFFMSLHYFIPYYVGLSNYLLAIWLGSIYLFGNFALSHTHLPVTTNSLHWVEYSLLHTTNIEPSWWCDWWMGYLNYQIEHHLFPTMPQYRHSKVVPRVRALALRHGIPYQCMSYGEAVVKSFANLHQVSKDLTN